jgi:hypothetical protein
MRTTAIALALALASTSALGGPRSDRVTPAQDRKIAAYIECVVGKAAAQFYRLNVFTPEKGDAASKVSDARQFAYAHCESFHPNAENADLSEIISDRLDSLFSHEITD